VQLSHFSNNAAGPQLPTYAVSVMQHIFGSDHLLLVVMQLAFTSCFYFYRPTSWIPARLWASGYSARPL